MYEDFIFKFPSVQELALASEEYLVECLSGVGLQRQRAHSLKRLSTWLLTKCEGNVPSDFESLLEVPGLGEYSAAAILSFGYHTPIAVLDGNVERIIVRVFGNSLPPRPSKAMLNEVVQRLLLPDNHREYNYGLLDLGRLVCRYTDPKCGLCPLNSVCDYFANTEVGAAQKPSRRHPESATNKLKAVRHKRGLSLKRLADLAGVSKLTIIRTESGRSSPKRETLEKLGAALEVEPNELLN